MIATSVLFSKVSVLGAGDSASIVFILGGMGLIFVIIPHIPRGMSDAVQSLKGYEPIEGALLRSLWFYRFQGVILIAAAFVIWMS